MDLALWSQSRKAVGGTRPGWARVKAGEAIPLAEPELSPSDDGRFLMQMKPNGAQFRPTSSTKAQPVGAMMRTHHSRTRTGNSARITYGVPGSPAGLGRGATGANRTPEQPGPKGSPSLSPHRHPVTMQDFGGHHTQLFAELSMVSPNPIERGRGRSRRGRGFTGRLVVTLC